MRDDPTQDRDELDILLDAALATYVDSEPSPSLRPRILAAASDLDRPSLGWLSWAIPALAAALLMTIFRTPRDIAADCRSLRPACSRINRTDSLHTP
jgi:hypothetical protein